MNIEEDGEEVEDGSRAVKNVTYEVYESFWKLQVITLIIMSNVYD
jgi:hypothetical protein